MRFPAVEVLFTVVLTGSVLLNTNIRAQDLSSDCAKNGGKWLVEFQECEYISRDWCQSAGGNFDGCTSACRHKGDPLMPCRQQCVAVCNFSKDWKMSQSKDPENCTYLINTRPVTLRNGTSQEEAVPGSALTITSRIILTGAKSNLNDDEYLDAPVLLVQTTGGSGAFFYVAAAFGAANGYRCTTALRIGDRIAPQNIEISNQTIIVNYTDRYPWESFAVEPSVIRSRSFVIDDSQLREKPFPILTPDVARKIVITKWGDCSPDTCRQLSVNVLDGGGGAWYVEATYDGMMDDSTRAQRKIAAAIYRNGDWMVEDPLVKQLRCQPGRGHEAFSPEPCH